VSEFTIDPRTRIGHVHLKVSDLERSERFYVDLLGFQVKTRYGSDAVWMGRHMAPWLLRRLRGVSSGDGRSAKRPELLPVAAAVPSGEPG